MTELMKFNPAFLDEETLVRSFVVRKREFETLMELIRENTVAVNQHVLVIGPRGIGKTTLVLRVATELRRDDELAKRWQPVVYGEESYGITNAGEFWLEALFQIGERANETRWKAAYEDLSAEKDPERLERRALSQLLDFSDEQGRRLLLIVENINMLLDDQVSDDEAWRLRHTLLNEPRLMLLGTATRRFEGIDHEGKSLYDLFRVVDLQPLDSLEDIGAVWALATRDKPEPAFLRPVEILTGGNPRLIRILSQFAARTSFRELMDNLIRLIDDHTEYFKHHLDGLPAQERKVFVALADRWDPGTARDIADATRLDVSKVSALLARLEGRGAVSVANQRGRTKVYQVAERLYNIYHLMRRRGQASARVRAVVRFMIAIYEGEQVIPIMRRLVDEALESPPEDRHEHYLAYTEVLDLVQPSLQARILAETSAQFDVLSDVPPDLQERLEGVRPDPYAHIPLDELVRIDVDAIDDTEELKQLAITLTSRPSTTATIPLIETWLRVSERLTSLAPGDAKSWRSRGEALEALGRHEVALESFDHALAIEPEDPAVWNNRGVALGRLGRDADALESFDHGLNIGPEDATVLSNRGVALAALGRNEEALESFDHALAIEPEVARVWRNRGAVLEALGRNEEALESFDRALAIEPEDATVWQSRGWALRKLGQDEEALESFDHAVALEPEEASGWNNRGFALDELGRHEEALESFDHAVAFEPEEASGWRNRGFALDELGRHEEALESFDHAVALEPKEASGWSNRGFALDELGRHEEALESYDRALAIEPEAALVWHIRSFALHELGRHAEALESYDRALAIDPQVAIVWRSRGWALHELGRHEEALESFDRALAIDPQAATVWRSRGWALHELGRYEEALESFDRALAIAPMATRFRINRGEILAELERFEEAFRDVESALKASIEPQELDDLTDVAVTLAAHDQTRRMLGILARSGIAEEVEPLLVGLRLDLNEEVEVAQEIMEVARDILDRIHTRRTEVKARP